MALQVKKLSDVKVPKLNVLIYGPPGHGKTYFTGTAIKATKLLILSAESGLLSLRKLTQDLAAKTGKPVDIDYIEVKKFGDIEAAFEELRFKNEGKYDAVAMDSLTEIQKVCMDSILEESKQETARIQDWGTLNNRMVAMIRGFRDLDMHFIVTALASNEKDEESQSFVTRPLLQGKLQDTLAGYFDEVFYLHSKEVKDDKGQLTTKRWLQTTGSGKVQAKDRSGVLPRECPADFAWVLKEISGIGKTEQAAKPALIVVEEKK